MDGVYLKPRNWVACGLPIMVISARNYSVNLLQSGIYKEKNLVEIAELQGHCFMIGVQFHPEFLSRPLRPHPLFKAFIEAMIKKQ